MAITEALTMGVSHTLTQNTVYAAPARACFVYSSLALEISYNGSNFGPLNAVGLESAIQTVAPFVRCTTGAAIVMFKAM